MDQQQRVLAMLAGVVTLGVMTQWVASRIKIPAILLLLAMGSLAGSGLHWIQPDEVFGDMLLPMVSLSVGLILFEGGLNLRLSELRGSSRSLFGLLTVGVLLTWFGATIAGIVVLELRKPVALLLGAVLTVTGPTVIGPLLRDIRPNGRVGVIAKWEGIMIDPIGATLALLVFEAIEAIRRAEYGSATVSALSGIGTVIVIGLIIGLGAAALLVLMLQRFWIPDHLQNAVTVALVVGAFAVSELLHHEAGLLAVTVMGIALANQHRVDVHRLIEFKESLTVILIAMLFILLSARVPMESLRSLGWRGPAFALVMIALVRPISVWIATLGSGLSIAERAFLCWLAPRGIVAAAVSSVFALRLGTKGAAIAPATFTVIFVTVAVYGLTAGRFARRLGLSNPDAQGLLIAGANQSARAIATALGKEGIRVTLVDTRYLRIRKSKDAGLTVCFANILSQHVLNQIDFSGLGRFLGLTSNDEINTLAAARFREIFGQQNCFQLASVEATHSRQGAEWKHHLAGRTLFAPELTYDFIDDALDHGGSLKTTKLTETFGFDAYLEHYRNRAWPLFLIDGQRVQIVTPGLKFAPKPGQLVVSLVLPPSGPAE